MVTKTVTKLMVGASDEVGESAESTGLVGETDGSTGLLVGALDGSAGLLVGALDGSTGLLVGALDGSTGLLV